MKKLSKNKVKKLIAQGLIQPTTKEETGQRIERLYNLIRNNYKNGNFDIHAPEFSDKRQERWFNWIDDNKIRVELILDGIFPDHFVSELKDCLKQVTIKKRTQKTVDLHFEMELLIYRIIRDFYYFSSIA